MKAIILPVALALAACHASPSVTADNASVAEVQAKGEGSGRAGGVPVAGSLESTVKIDRMDIPGLPAGLAATMQRATAGKVSSSCLTPEQAKKPAAEFFAGKDRKDCRYDHFAMGSGTLDATMTCGGHEGGGAATIAMKGGYGPDAFHLAMTMDAKGASGATAAMHMAATVDSKRTGACTGKEGS